MRFQINTELILTIFIDLICLSFIEVAQLSIWKKQKV